jgi:hypothetical protein
MKKEGNDGLEKKYDTKELTLYTLKEFLPPSHDCIARSL